MAAAESKSPAKHAWWTASRAASTRVIETALGSRDRSSARQERRESSQGAQTIGPEPERSRDCVEPDAAIRRQWQPVERCFDQAGALRFHAVPVAKTRTRETRSVPRPRPARPCVLEP